MKGKRVKGTLERRGNVWLARWIINGKRFTRSTGCRVDGGIKSRKEALERLAEFTNDYALRDEKLTLEKQVARLGGIEREIEAEEAKKPALRFMEGWTAYVQSQSRPRSGAETMRNYELQYFQFVTWIKEHHPEATELRQVSQEIAEEYAQFLLSGTPTTEQDEIHAARLWLYRFDYRQKRDGARELSQDEKQAISERRTMAAREIRKPIRGATFNKHINALALIWRHVTRNGKARITTNPWAFDENTGAGIRRITLNHAERPHTRRAMTETEVCALLKAAKGEMRVLIAIGIYTGLRLGDAALLKWANIDRVTGVMSVISRKTDTETRTAIHPTLAMIIDDETKNRTGYVIPKIAKLYASGKSGRVKLSNELGALFKSVGIETQFVEEGKRARSDCGFHSLRHTFVTLLRNNGARLQTAKELAGHNTERMTEHYTHDSERAVLALPDMSGAHAAPAPAAPIGGISLDQLKAALAALTPKQRATLLAK